MINAPTDWLQKLPGSADLCALFLEHFDDCAAGMRAALAANEKVHAYFSQLPAEQLQASQRETRRRVELAFAGDWDSYADKLRRDGAAYAALGFSFADWFSIAAAWTDPLMPVLLGRLGHDAPRLAAALLALQLYRDRALMTLGESFIAASHEESIARERELRVTFESIADAVITTDESAVIVRANRRACEIVGVEVLVGRPLAEVWHPQLEPAGLEPEDLRLCRPDGSSISVSKSRAPVVGEGGMKRGEIIVFRDVSESRRRLLELKRWEALFQNIGWGICITDSTGANLAQCNAAFLRMFGFEGHDPARTLQSLFEPDDMVRVWRDVGPLANETGRASYDAIALRADGTTFPVHAEAVRVPSVDKQPAWVVSIHDLTERRQIEALQSHARDLEAENRHVQETSRLKSEFLANMSHELRTPLNSILGFSELLHHGEVGELSEQQRDFVGDIHTSGKHLLRLINDILDLSKVEAGKIEFYPEEASLSGLAAEVTGILRGVAQTSGIRIDVSVHPAVDAVFLDPSRLKQVLYNYLSNAIKFTPAGGRVELRIEGEDAHSFRVEVEDTGIGISAEDIGRLFTEFGQLDAGRTKGHGGTGLGLALTRRLVEAQHGSVGVKSEAGRGCVFHAVLPLRATTPSPLTPPTRSDGSAPSAPRILVVEDDPADQRRIAAVLQAAEYAVDTVSTTAQALEALQSASYAAITLDLLLPDGDGLSLLQKARGMPGYATVPVVVISMVASQVTAAFAVQEALQKPFREQDLFAALARMDVRAPGPVLIVDDDGPSVRLLGTSLAHIGIDFVVAENGVEGLARAAEQQPSCVILDLIMPVLDGFGFLREFRQRAEWARVPVLVWTTHDLTGQERAHLMRSAEGVLVKDGAGGAALLEAIATFLPRVRPPTG